MDRYLRMENETRGAGGERAHRTTGSGTRSGAKPSRVWLAVMGRSVSMRADPRIAPGCGGIKAGPLITPALFSRPSTRPPGEKREKLAGMSLKPLSPRQGWVEGRER